MMNSVERISTLIPKFKQQLIFLEEREKLFKKINDYAVQCDDSLSTMATNSQTTSMVSINSQTTSFVPVPTTDSFSKDYMDNSRSDHSGIDADISLAFPDDYKIPLLPSALIKDIEDGILQKFGPHCANRQILIDAIAYDLIDKYNLFYPTHKQFDAIGNSIVKYMKLPLTKQNIAIWKDALQTKLKRKRFENQNNTVVQDYRLKYSRSGSGRPVKRKIGETAERDRYKQMVIIPYNDDASNDIQLKLDQLRDTTTIDIHTQLYLWKETFCFRRQSIRDRSTADVLKDFSGYGNSLLVFEEVKMLMKIDLSAAVRRQIPVLLDKMLETPMFITDSPPIRLIKVLCRQFDETLQHTLCDMEPTTPYPTLVCIDDLIHVYVDFNPILSTSSPDDAVALLIAMYTIFELAFDKKSRTIRFLYSVLHGDKRHLSNSIRFLIKEKNIDIHCEQHQISSASSNSACNSSTVPDIEFLTQSQIQMNSSHDSINGQDYSTFIQTVEPKPSDNNSNSNILVATHEYRNNIEKAPLVSLDSQNTTKQQRKRKINTNLDDENAACLKTSGKNDHQLSTPHQDPLNDVTNAPAHTRQNKKKRRS
ncbi:unnamed protein product [Rotaria sp. Silwood2]|nr:unnamed protein product [Rotaria sp. Silwood2]CAF4424707.1 unnamed protein product [Rotaria sp. Silwood2]